MCSYSVIILAAGNGSRLKSSTLKVLHKVGGLALLDHVIRSAKSINPKEVVVITKPDFSMDQLKFADGVITAFQNVQKGTAHAVQCGLSVLSKKNDSKNNEWVYVLYADIPLVTPETLMEMQKVAYICEKTGIVVLAMDSSGAKNLGKLEAADEKGTIKSIVEAKDSQNSTKKLLPLCNCGLLIKRSLLDKFIGTIKPSSVTNEFYITELVRMAYENGYICRYYEADARELSGANTLAEMAVLERNFQDIMREKAMANGVKLIAPETVFFSYDTEIEPDVVVQPFVMFYEGVRIKKGAIIGPFCVVEGARVGMAQVGPFSRLRPGTEINDRAKIGNFVEIKKSVVSEGAKINHLTYIGDSFIGKNTNIGAGTITCNYDGVHKHKTHIGENVFVGSNSALVAPIEIGDNATVGAGSVITDDVPKDALAVARGRQRNIDDWKSKSNK